jgi:glutamyl/glutaminyl-tRNA synthetase
MLKTRIAPTPSGLLHFGNALSFAITAALAEKLEAVIMLRIDDLDEKRIKPEYIQDVFDTLDQLGIFPVEGPKNSEQLNAKWSQQLRVDSYQRAINKLIKAGHAYSCGCSRKDLEEISPNGSDHGCRALLKVEIDEKPIRIRLPQPCIILFQDELLGEVSIDLNEVMPDFILRKRDGTPSYQIASLVDDVQFGANLIVRGEDLVASTGAQLYLANLLGLSVFSESKFFHHQLVKDLDGNKLSKTVGADSLKSLRESDVKDKMVFQRLSALIGMEPAAENLHGFKVNLNLQMLKQP